MATTDTPATSSFFSSAFKKKFPLPPNIGALSFQEAGIPAHPEAGRGFGGGRVNAAEEGFITPVSREQADSTVQSAANMGPSLLGITTQRPFMTSDEEFKRLGGFNPEDVGIINARIRERQAGETNTATALSPNMAKAVDAQGRTTFTGAGGGTAAEPFSYIAQLKSLQAIDPEKYGNAVAPAPDFGNMTIPEILSWKAQQGVIQRAATQANKATEAASLSALQGLQGQEFAQKAAGQAQIAQMQAKIADPNTPVPEASRLIQALHGMGANPYTTAVRHGVGGIAEGYDIVNLREGTARPGGATTETVPLPPKEQRQVGKVYSAPGGNFKWDGTGLVKV